MQQKGNISYEVNDSQFPSKMYTVRSSPGQLLDFTLFRFEFTALWNIKVSDDYSLQYIMSTS